MSAGPLALSGAPSSPLALMLTADVRGAVETSTVAALNGEPLVRASGVPIGNKACTQTVATISHNQLFQASSACLRANVHPSTAWH